MSAADLESYSDFFNTVFTAHRMGHHIVYCNRKLFARLSDIHDLSRSSKVTLNQISNKLHEYTSAACQSSRVIMVVPNSIQANFMINGRYVLVSTRILSEQHLLCQKIFLAENLTDTKFIGVLSDVVYKTRQFPRHFVCSNRVGGGGNTLADVLSGEADRVSPLKGVALCDLDDCLDPPAFQLNTTAGRAFNQAVALGLIDGQLGLSRCSPFFAFEITAGHSIENYVGPNLLNCYFDNQNRRRERQPFLTAFPNFPTLNAEEMFIWMRLNLKNGTGNFKGVFDAVRKNMGQVPLWITERSSHYSRLSIPNDVIRWVINNAAATRWSGSIEQAIISDLGNAIYGRAINGHAKILQDVASGDRNARMT